MACTAGPVPEIIDKSSVGKNDVQVVDLNADGFKDIMLVGGEDHAGTKWYKTWIYDSQQQKYLWIAKAFGKD